MPIRASQHSEHDALYGLAPVQGIFSGYQGGLPIKCGVQLRKQYYFDRLSPGKQPLRSAHTTIEKDQRSSPARPFLRVFARHA